MFLVFLSLVLMAAGLVSLAVSALTLSQRSPARARVVLDERVRRRFVDYRKRRSSASRSSASASASGTESAEGLAALGPGLAALAGPAHAADRPARVRETGRMQLLSV